MGMGHLQGMRVVLKRNRDILRKTGLFKKDQSFLSSRKAYLKAAKGELNFKTISKSDLLALREKVIKKRKAESIRAWLIALGLMIPILALGIFIANAFTAPENFQYIEQKESVELKLTIDLNKFSYYLEDGDMWITKRNWNNAIYRYEQAVALFPNEFEGNLRLALAYNYRCKDENKDCEIGKKLTTRLLKYYPNEPGLTELKAAFDE